MNPTRKIVIEVPASEAMVEMLGILCLDLADKAARDYAVAAGRPDLAAALRTFHKAIQNRRTVTA